MKKIIFFSIVIPAHNEAENIKATCDAIAAKFAENQVEDYEILIVNDNSSDGTEQGLKDLTKSYPDIVRYINNSPPNGFGYAVRKGLENFDGESVCLVMADLSDSPEDIFRYYQLMKQGHFCAFGSRFIKGGSISGYPPFKLVINRLANWFIKILFMLDHNDITNAFKCYRKEVIRDIQPISSHHFDLTVELPLKAIARGYPYVKIPISWKTRKKGISNLRLKEMGGKYLRVVLSIFLEKISNRAIQKKR